MVKKVRRAVPKRRTRRRPAMPLEDKSISVRCAFCRGVGRDPFGLLSALSTCQVCMGRGEVRVLPPTAPCAFCRGTGVQPYTTSRLHCLACGGQGVVTAIEPSQECSTCHGRGIYPRQPHPVHCQTCRGQGIVVSRG